MKWGCSYHQVTLIAYSRIVLIANKMATKGYEC